MFPVQLDLCHKRSGTRRLLRHSEKKNPFGPIHRSNFTNWANPKLHKIFLML